MYFTSPAKILFVDYQMSIDLQVNLNLILKYFLRLVLQLVSPRKYNAHSCSRQLQCFSYRSEVMYIVVICLFNVSLDTLCEMRVC